MANFYPEPWKPSYFWNKFSSFVNPPGCVEFSYCKDACDAAFNNTDGQCIAFNFYHNNCPGATEGSCYLLAKSDLQYAQEDASTYGNITSYIISNKETIQLPNPDNSSENVLNNLQIYKNLTLYLSIGTVIIFIILMRRISFKK